MRRLAFICVFICFLGVVSSQFGVGFGSFAGVPGQPSILGSSSNVNSPTPTGPRGCFCLPPNQKCDPNGLVPAGSTRISKIQTKIVNINPNSACPQGQIQCCFGSVVSPNPLPPITTPIGSCGGQFSPLVLTGQPGTPEADFAEYPWMTAIVKPNHQFVAGGVLIHPSWVLTAAHKVVQPGPLVARVGDYDLAKVNEVPSFPHVEIPVVQVIYHPDFNPSNLFNDVALLRLQRPVTISKHIIPACLPERGQLFSGQRCFVSGWGQNLSGSFQAVLKEVDLPIVDGFDCQERLRRTKLGRGFQLNMDSFVCAGGETGKDACSGDGGSPLVCKEGNFYTVIGLVAWGIGCGQEGIPGAYVNVASFAPFITNTIRS